MRFKTLIGALSKLREPPPLPACVLLFVFLAAASLFLFHEGIHSAWGRFFAEMVVIWVVVGYLPFYLAYVVAFWYRWSLKSTTVVWLPLLYIAADVTARGWSAERRLSRAVHSRFAASMRRFGTTCSALILGWLVLRAVGVGVHPILVEFSPAIERYFGGTAVVAVAAWSFASVVNTALAWIVYWVADAELDRRKHGEGRTDAKVLRWLKLITLTRWCLFAFSWACTLWVAVEIVTHSKPIPLAPRWLPWTTVDG